MSLVSSLAIGPIQAAGATTVLSASQSPSHAPHQENELLAMTACLHRDISHRSSCYLPGMSEPNSFPPGLL